MDNTANKNQETEVARRLPCTLGLRRLVGETPAELKETLTVMQSPKLFRDRCIRFFEAKDFPFLCPDDSIPRVHFLTPTDLNDRQLSSLAKVVMHEAVSDSWERATALVQSVSDMYFILKGSQLSAQSLEHIRGGYMYLDMFGRLEEWFKFQTTYLSALLLKQKELPPVPSWLQGNEGFVCGGRFYREIRNLLNKPTITKEVLRWAMSIVALKRGAMPLRPEEVLKNLEKHSSKLGTPPPKPRDDVEQRRHLMVVQCIQRVVHEVLWGTDSGTRIISNLKWRMPSGSSHWQWTRANCGALGAIAQQVKLSYGVFSGTPNELVGYTQGFEPMPIYAPSYMYDIMDKILKGAKTEGLDCQVHVVLEPMKARVITSGPPLRYHTCRMLQKVIHSKMRTNPVFRLIGEPCTQDVVRENFRGLDSLQHAWDYVSADYSAATDNLNGEYSRCYTIEVAKALGLDGKVLEIFEKSMLGHILHYPEEFGVQDTLQLTGQLMGSPSSFPGLCVINIAALWAAFIDFSLYELEQRKKDQFLGTIPKTPQEIARCFEWDYFVRTVRPMVNGDDLLYKSPKGLERFWNQYLNLVGLTKSPGKNYVSSEFFVINSTAFLSDSTIDFVEHLGRNGVNSRMAYRKNTSIRVHWVNPGLLKGQARVLLDTRRERPEEETIDFGQLRSQLAWLQDWDDGEEERHRRTNDIWFRNMSSVLLKQDRSWRLPIALGGLGLPFGSATRPQLVFANMIVKCQKWDLASRMEVRSGEINSVSRAQLQREIRMMKELGCTKKPKSLKNYTFVKECVERIDDDGIRTFVDIVKAVDEKEVDMRIPEWLVGFPTDIEISELSDKKVVHFLEMMNMVRKFPGGPMRLEEALLYSDNLVWTGPTIRLPDLRFMVLEDHLEGKMTEAGERLYNERYAVNNDVSVSDAMDIDW